MTNRLDRQTSRKVGHDLFSLALCCCLAGQLMAAPVDDESTADRLRAAIDFQMDGDQHYSDLLFNYVLRNRPQEPLAHWRRGEVQVDGDWVPVDDSAAWQPLPAWWAKYEQLRAAAMADPARELQLAAWCASQGDAELARVHYRRVLDQRESDESQRAVAANAHRSRDGGRTMADAGGGAGVGGIAAVGSSGFPGLDATVGSLEEVVLAK